jgi:hypothetical protein
LQNLILVKFSDANDWSLSALSVEFLEAALGRVVSQHSLVSEAHEDLSFGEVGPCHRGDLLLLGQGAQVARHVLNLRRVGTLEKAQPCKNISLSVYRETRGFRHTFEDSSLGADEDVEIVRKHHRHSGTGWRNWFGRLFLKI